MILTEAGSFRCGGSVSQIAVLAFSKPFVGMLFAPKSSLMCRSSGAHFKILVTSLHPLVSALFDFLGWFRSCDVKCELEILSLGISASIYLPSVSTVEIKIPDGHKTSSLAPPKLGNQVALIVSSYEKHLWEYGQIDIQNSITRQTVL